MSHAVPRGVSPCPQRCEPLCPAQEPQNPLHESLCRCGRAAASHVRAAPPTGRLFAAHQKHHPPPAHPPFPGDMVPPPNKAIQLPAGPRESKCPQAGSPQASPRAQFQPAALHHRRAAPTTTPQQKQAQPSSSSSKHPTRCHIPHGAITLQPRVRTVQKKLCRDPRHPAWFLCLSFPDSPAAALHPAKLMEHSDPWAPSVCTHQTGSSERDVSISRQK